MRIVRVWCTPHATYPHKSRGPSIVPSHDPPHVPPTNCSALFIDDDNTATATDEAQLRAQVLAQFEDSDGDADGDDAVPLPVPTPPDDSEPFVAMQGISPIEIPSSDSDDDELDTPLSTLAKAGRKYPESKAPASPERGVGPSSRPSTRPESNSKPNHTIEIRLKYGSKMFDARYDVEAKV